MQAYQECLELLITEFSTGEFYRELFEAKQEYFLESGVVSEDDPDFENQMDIFMGWYLFDRPLSEHDLPPVKLYFRRNRDNMNEEQLEKFTALTETIHSIFEVVKQRGDKLVLREYCTRKKMEVEDDRYNYGFSKGDVFEARIIPSGKKTYCFASGFCFHPQDSVKFIDSQIKKIRYQDLEQRNQLLLKLNQMKMKHLRYPHIDVSYIYTLNPKF